MQRTSRRTPAALGGVALVFALVAGASTPAAAWGGPTYFLWPTQDCSGYSVKSSSSSAGANTINNTSNSWSLRVAFKYPGHTDVAPVTGTGTVIAYAYTESIVSLLSGGRHKCGESSIDT